MSCIIIVSIDIILFYGPLPLFLLIISFKLVIKCVFSHVIIYHGLALNQIVIFMQLILQTTSRPKYFGIQRKPLPLEPTVLLREANRRRASLSAGNVFEVFDGHLGTFDG